MALKYKINVLDALKEKGYSSYTLRKEKLLSEIKNFSKLIIWQYFIT